MTDYKKIADIMMPADRRSMDKKDFDALMERRNLKFVQDIDIVDETNREVWGNSVFEIIVLHKGTNYQIL